MSDNQQQEDVKEVPEFWANLQIKGFVSLYGIVSKPGGAYGTLWQINALDDTTSSGFHTEYFGDGAIHRMIPMSKEIAMQMYKAGKQSPILEYDAPVITREQHQVAMERLRQELETTRRRLTATVDTDAFLGKGEDHEDDTGEDQEDDLDGREDFEE